MERTDFNYTREFVASINKNYIHTFVSDAYCLVHNMPQEEIVGQSMPDVWGLEVFETAFKEDIDNCFSGKEVRHEGQLAPTDEKPHSFDITYYPRTDQKGTVTEVLAVFRDITDRSNIVDQRFHESYMQFQSLCLTTSTVIFIFQGDKIRYTNPAAEKVTGYTQEELLQMDFWDVIHPDFQETVRERGLARQRDEDIPSRYELKILAKDGRKRWLDASLSSVELNGKVAILGTAVDITDRKRAEQEREQLLELERQQRILAETLGEVFLALTSKIRREAILNEILRQAQHLIPHSAANITLLTKNTLQVVHWYGYEEFDKEVRIANLIQDLSELPLDRQIIESCQSLIIPDTDQNRDWVQMKHTSWIKSSISVPIFAKDSVFGLLRLDSDTPNNFSQNHLRYLEPLAGAAALALENSRLYEQALNELVERKLIQKEVERLNQKLLSVQFVGATIASSLDLDVILDTVVRELVGALGINGCTFYLWDQDSNTISILTSRGIVKLFRQERTDGRTYNLAELSLHEQTLKGRSSIQLNVNRTDPNSRELAYLHSIQAKALLLLPMETQDKTIGIIELTDHEIEQVYPSHDVAIAQLLANQAAGAIENARLFTQTQREIDERVRVEKQLRQIIRINHAILETIPDVILYLNHEGDILRHNIRNKSHFITEILDEFRKANNLREISGLSDECVGLFLSHIENALISDAVQTFDCPVSAISGQYVLEVRLVVSNPNEILAIIRDITNIILAEAKLKTERNLLRTIIDNIPDFIFVLDSEGRYVISNKAHVNLVGMSKPGEVLGKTPFDFFPSELAKQFHKENQIVIETGKPLFNQENFLIDQQGRQKWWITTKVPLYDIHNKETGIVSIGRDITQQKQAELALQASEVNLRTILDSSNQAFLLIDTDYKIVLFNKIAQLGFRSALNVELGQNVPIDQILPKAKYDEFYSALAKALQGKAAKVEKRIKFRKTEKWFELQFNPVFSEDDQIVGACLSSIDIDDRKRIHDTLAKSEQRLWSELRGVLTVTRAMVTETNVEDLLKVVVDQTKSLTGAGQTTALLLSDDGQLIEPIDHKNSSTIQMFRTNLQIKGSLAEAALSDGRVKFSDNPDDFRFVETLTTSPLSPSNQAIFCAPLLSQHRRLGVLLIWDLPEYVNIASVKRLLEIFADQVALALYNAELFKQNQFLAIEQERNRIARDLHDTVEQSLYSIGVSAQALARLVPKNLEPSLEGTITYIHQLSQTTLAEIRDQLAHLHPVSLNKINLVQVLSEHCAKLNRQYAPNIEFSGNLKLNLSAQQQESLYYITREAVWNAIKYAQAKQIQTTLMGDEKYIELEVTDDGVGFNPKTDVKWNSLGLKYIQERVDILNGSLTIHTHPGNGTQIRVRLPVVR